jgi:tetratricopeptide (TPR) repeat protein
MGETSAAGATPPVAPMRFPVFAAVAVAITGRGVYDVIEQVGGIFEGAGAVFEGSPDAPGTLLALLPPSDAAAIQAVHLGLQAQAAAPTLRLGVDATEVRAKKDQDAKWQEVIDSALRLQTAARTGEAIAGDGIDHLTHGAAATEPLQVGGETFLLLTGVRDLAAVALPVVDAVPEPDSVDGAPNEPARVETDMESTLWAIPAVEPEPPPGVEAPATSPVQVEPAAITEASPAAPSPGAATPATHPTSRWNGTLIGRDEQLADLRARFDRVEAERTASCVLITGEPGSGRTRLVHELAGSLENARIVTVGCAPADVGGARWPLAAIVEAIAGLNALAPAEPTRARLAELFAGHADADRVIPHLLAMLALEGVTEADRVPWTIRRLIEVASNDTPTLVQIDDADRAGAGLPRLLADIAAAVRDAPVLIAITTTTESEGIPAIRLERLSDADAARMITDLLGEVEQGVDMRIAGRANGVPLAVEQTLALLIESGTLAPGQGRWLPLADLARVPIPDTTIGAIRQRLHTLPPRELDVLRIAAVAGERFDLGPLLEAVPGDAGSDVPASLEDLVARGFLTGGPETFAFRHPLLRETTMSEVADPAGATAHERFGRHVEREAGERTWRFAEAIGRHLEASCRLRPEGPTLDRADALRLLLWSADAAVEQGDFDGAGRLERVAATIVDDDPQRRAELLSLAAEHGVQAAPDRAADREIAAALAASEADDDVQQRVRLLRARVQTLGGQEDALENARAAADDAIAASAEDERSWALSSAWSLRALVHAARAQNGLVAEDLCTAADNAAAANRRLEETAALRGAAAALLDGPVPVGDAEARCVGFLDRVHGPLAEHDVRGTIAVLRARRGRIDEAREGIAGPIVALEELGAAGDLSVALCRAAEIELLAGQTQTAEAQMHRALAAATHARDDALRARLAASFAHLLVADEARLDDATAHADVGEAFAEDMTTQVAWRMARARIMARRGRGAQAERLVREGLGIAEQTDSTDLRANALLWAADVRRRAGRPAEAEPFERRALRLLERQGAIARTATPVAGSSTPAPHRPTPAADTWSGMAPEETAAPPATADTGVEPAAAPDPAPPVEEGPAEQPITPADRPSVEIDPADELLEDPTRNAEQESHRRWFSR